MKRTLLAVAVLLAGCGEDTLPGNADMAEVDLTPPGDMAVTIDQACADLAAQVCSRIAACEPWVLQFQFGDQSTCTTRYKLSCILGASAKGLTNVTGTFEACAQAIALLSCPDIVVGNSPAACKPMMGTQADGLACAQPGQCQSLYCNQMKMGGCGACGPPPKAGDPCANLVTCGDGLTCAMNGTCQPLVAQSGACDAGHPCGPQLTCVGANMMGTCQPHLGPGQNCDATNATTAQCDFLQGLYCKTAPMTTNGTCALVGLAKPGEMCGLINGGFVVCQAAGKCAFTQMNPPLGTCVAPAADGAACDEQKGPGCVSPAVCFGGICRLPNPSACG